MDTRTMYGRRVITTDVSEITADNVVEVLKKAMEDHELNRGEIEYLWKYFKGNQPILQRTKTVRPEICNKIVENRANEIVSFKVGYLCGEPIQYVGRSNDTTVGDSICALNEYMFIVDKAALDREIVEWQMIAGTANRMILDNEAFEKDSDEAPFEMYTLDPRDSFVVYSTDVKHKRMMGVKYNTDDHGFKTYSVYTDELYFTIEDDQVKKVVPHALGAVNIVEYPANNARLGSFEIVLPLLDAINNIESNRMDGVEQFIQSFMKFINCDIDEEKFKALKDLGAIKIKSADGQPADVDIVTSELDQGQTQVTKDDLYKAILSICGLPSMSDGSTSDSSNNGAVILKNGWQGAETRAKDSELMFKRSEKEILKLVLKLCDGLADLKLRLKDIDMKFTRRNYDNIQSKSQVLATMLQQPKVHPLLAFTHCGMFSDPESAYSMSNKYYEEQMAKWEPVDVDEDDDSDNDVVNKEKSDVQTS
ncbi:MAG: phage portal protein [Bacteroidales bacterium]|nr:phage portal protein [Bacteroidales bacterium]